MTHGAIDQGAPDASPLVEPWNLVADGYVAGVLPMMEHFAREALQLAVLPPSPHIVDVATGPGTLAFLAAIDGATVSAIDFSPGMVTNFHRREKEAGLRFADVRVGDGQDLPYDDNKKVVKAYKRLPYRFVLSSSSLLLIEAGYLLSSNSCFMVRASPVRVSVNATSTTALLSSVVLSPVR